MKPWMAFVALLLAVIGYFVLRVLRYVRHLRERQLGFTKIQRNAFRNISAASEGQDVRGSTDAELHSQSFRTSGGLSLVYTIVHDEGAYVHHVSAKAPGRSRKFVVDEMLLVMADFIAQFQECGFSENLKPKFESAESDLGTQHLQCSLSQTQHEALAALVDKA